jgi:hypothetical protein
VPSFRTAVERDNWPDLSPNAIVVTSADTYSAGFDVALPLRALGARHVGSPSAQAPNCFMDVLGFKLPHSGLEGTISFKDSCALPGIDLPERVLETRMSYSPLSACGHLDSTQQRACGSPSMRWWAGRRTMVNTCLSGGVHACCFRVARPRPDP